MNANETIEKLRNLEQSFCKGQKFASAVLMREAISFMEVMGKDGEMLDWLTNAAGFIADNSFQKVTFYADDAARTWNLEIGNKWKGDGYGIRSAISAAMKKEAQA